MPVWLTRPSPPGAGGSRTRDGGTGALYALLRNPRKAARR